jgi:hypothetical protein
MSLKMAHKVILPPKKNYIPQFLKQRDINSYYFLSVLEPQQEHTRFAVVIPRIPCHMRGASTVPGPHF